MEKEKWEEKSKVPGSSAYNNRRWVESKEKE
jgi:hypothetical protein